MHPLAEGFTVIESVTGVIPVFNPMEEGIKLPVESFNPMVLIELTHEKEVPGTFPEKKMIPPGWLLHTVSFGTGFTDGIGLTVRVNVFEIPVHPLAVGVTVILLLTGTEVLFMVVKAGIDPVPERLIPVLSFELIQLKTVPKTSPEKSFGCVNCIPAQRVVSFT